jgi:hypothetical protein
VHEVNRPAFVRLYQLRPRLSKSGSLPWFASLALELQPFLDVEVMFTLVFEHDAIAPAPARGADANRKSAKVVASSRTRRRTGWGGVVLRLIPAALRSTANARWARGWLT